MRLFDQEVHTADDVFALRQRSRQVAAVAGLDAADQVRLATALSELGRDLLASGGDGAVDFALDVTDGRLVVGCVGLSAAELEKSAGLQATQRLLTHVSVEGPMPATAPARVVIRLALPARPTAEDARGMQQQIADQVVLSPLDELRGQNRELLAAMEELTTRHREVTDLNAELDRTNQGVMAMYTQLSEELETTNRGVVALYAELDETTKRLEETTEARTRFLNNVSHELRSPVNSIVGLSQLLLEPDSAPVDPEQRRQISLIAATGAELLSLVNQLLDLARAEFGRVEPDLDRVDIADLAAHVLAALQPSARPGVELNLVGDETMVVLTDANLLRQVVRNLVANALAFTTAGAVTVRTAIVDDEVVIDVADTGIGIPEQDLERVFEEFFQIRGPHQAARQGSGLGLPYSRRVAQLLGGRLTVTSRLGHGSTFTVHLPHRRETTDAAPPPPLQLGAVLLADDDPSFRQDLRAMLAGVAGEIVEAADGVQALAQLRAQPFDLVVLDLMMPQLDGYGVLEQMAREPALSAVPVLVVTSTEPSRVRAPRAAGVLAKRDLDQSRLVRAIALAREASDG